jgi:hypothetical protein
MREFPGFSRSEFTAGLSFFRHAALSEPDALPDEKILAIY